MAGNLPFRLRDRRGMIVLGPLIVLVVVVVLLVVLGKLFRYQYPDRYPATYAQRELRYVAAPLEIRDGGRVTARLAPGDSVWTYRMDSGDVVVFAGPRGDRVLGVVREAPLSAVRPARGR